jgi:hypothetical protein
MFEICFKTWLIDIFHAKLKLNPFIFLFLELKFYLNLFSNKKILT